MKRSPLFTLRSGLGIAVLMILTAALVASPMTAEMTQATSSTTTSGLRKRAKNCQMAC